MVDSTIDDMRDQRVIISSRFAFSEQLPGKSSGSKTTAPNTVALIAVTFNYSIIIVQVTAPASDDEDLEPDNTDLPDDAEQLLFEESLSDDESNQSNSGEGSDAPVQAATAKPAKNKVRK